MAAEDLDAIRGLKRQAVDFGILIRDPRTPAGVRRRATQTVLELAVRICDAAEALVKSQQAAEAVKEHELV